MQNKEKMSSYNFNIPELLKQHFPFKLGFATQAVANKVLNGLDDIPVLPTNNELAKVSATGTPVWDYIELGSKIIEGTGNEFSGYEFPLEMSIELTRPRKIVETDVFGRDGMIEEFIGLDDWNMIIRGLIINYESTDYPEEKVKELQRVCELPTSWIPCSGTLFSILDIRYLSIHRLDLIPSLGYSNMQAFQIDAKSKIPFIIEP